MKSVIKAILIIILSFGIGLNYVGAALQENDGSSGSILEGDGTRIPICAKGECGVNGSSLESGGKQAKEVFEKMGHKTIQTEKKFSDYAQDIIKYLMTFLTIIGVMYIIYAGLLLLTSSGEEEKMTRARKNIFYVMIGITVIHLAYPIVNWVLKAIS